MARCSIRDPGIPLDTRECDVRWHLSSSVQFVIILLAFDPTSQLGVFATAPRNIAMPVDFAIVGKLVETLLLDGALTAPLKTKVFRFLNMRERDIRCPSF
jgi:hypothetical protein